MEITYRTKLVRRLNASELDACRKLTYRGKGLMEAELMLHYSGDDGWSFSDDQARAIMAFNDDGAMIGWCLAFDRITRRAKKELHRPTTYFYIKPTYRRQGIATRLMQIALRHKKSPTCFAGSRANNALFEKFSKRIKIVA